MQQLEKLPNPEWYNGHPNSGVDGKDRPVLSPGTLNG